MGACSVPPGRPGVPGAPPSAEAVPFSIVLQRNREAEGVCSFPSGRPACGVPGALHPFSIALDMWRGVPPTLDGGVRCPVPLSVVVWPLHTLDRLYHSRLTRQFSAFYTVLGWPNNSRLSIQF